MSDYIILQRSMIRILLAVGFAALVLVVFRPELFAVKAFVLGLGIGLLCFRILGRSVERAAVSTEAAARKSAVVAFALRYVIIALGVCAVVRRGAGPVIAYAGGVFLPYASTALIGILLARGNSDA